MLHVYVPGQNINGGYLLEPPHWKVHSDQDLAAMFIISSVSLFNLTTLSECPKF